MGFEHLNDMNHRLALYLEGFGDMFSIWGSFDS